MFMYLDEKERESKINTHTHSFFVSWVTPQMSATARGEAG